MSNKFCGTVDRVCQGYDNIQALQRIPTEQVTKSTSTTDLSVPWLIPVGTVKLRNVEEDDSLSKLQAKIHSNRSSINSSIASNSSGRIPCALCGQKCRGTSMEKFQNCVHEAIFAWCADIGREKYLPYATSHDAAIPKAKRMFVISAGAKINDGGLTAWDVARFSVPDTSASLLKKSTTTTVRKSSTTKVLKALPPGLKQRKSSEQLRQISGDSKLKRMSQVPINRRIKRIRIATGTSSANFPKQRRLRMPDECDEVLNEELYDRNPRERLGVLIKPVLPRTTLMNGDEEISRFHNSIVISTMMWLASFLSLLTTLIFKR